MYEYQFYYNGNSNNLFFNTDYNCNDNINGTLQICDGCFVQTSGNTSIKYYGGDLQILGNNSQTTYINSSQSTILISERCSIKNSFLIGGDNQIPNDNNKYNMIILRDELSLLFRKNIIFESLLGNIIWLVLYNWLIWMGF